MECYKLTGKETEEELNAIYLQIVDDYSVYGLVSIIEKDKTIN
jgi:hypothetical protein